MNARVASMMDPVLLSDSIGDFAANDRLQHKQNAHYGLLSVRKWQHGMRR